MVTRIREDNGGFDPFGDQAAAGTTLIGVDGEEFVEALLEKVELAVSVLNERPGEQMRPRFRHFLDAMRALIADGEHHLANDLFMVWDAHLSGAATPEEVWGMSVAIHSLPGAQAWYRRMMGLES